MWGGDASNCLRPPLAVIGPSWQSGDAGRRQLRLGQGQRVDKNDLVGTWKGLGHDVTAPDGTVTYPHGKDHPASLIYTADGHMAVVATRKDRKKFTSPVSGRDISAATLEEKAAAAEGCVAYFGRYEVEGEEVLHHIEVCLFPNWEGTTQRRFARLDGDRLTLSMAREGDGAVSRVYWKRL